VVEVYGLLIAAALFAGLGLAAWLGGVDSRDGRCNWF
jgi:hypothetical protein